MHAQPRYQPPNSRFAGAGGALAICAGFGAMIAMLAPQIVTVIKDPPIQTYPVPIDPPPPPEPIDKPVPRAEPQTQRLVAPPRDIPIPADPSFTTVRDIPLTPPEPVIAERVGPTIVADPPRPPLPLVPATPDARADFKAPYPTIELRAGRDGVVVLRVLIGADGRVKAAEQVSATSAAFFEAARKQALAKWRFRPATRGGIAEESWKTMTVRFRIDEQ